jgi:C-terminal processing protease CtpA/Prc
MSIIKLPILLLTLGLLLPDLLQSQTPSLTPQQTKRLADAGKLWGYIKYFHPYLQYKSINWDSAFAAAVPSIIEATDKASYAKALQPWLDILHDPITTVMPGAITGVQYSKENPSPTLVTKDSILFVTIRNLKDLDNWQLAISTLQKIPRQLSEVRYLVFDLRPTQPYAWADLGGLLDYGNIEAGLCSGTLYKPSTRSIVHDGFVPERGGSSGGYSSFFKFNQISTVTGTQKNPVPIAFLVNENMPLPALALTLQDAGKALVVSEGPLNLGNSNLAMRYSIADSVVISLRTGEVVRKNGKTAITPNAVFEKQSDLQVNLDKTVALLKAGIPTPTESRETLPLESLPKMAGYPNDKRYCSLGNRVLAAAKIYTVINTFFVNKKLMDQSLDKVYEQYLPRFVAAKDSMEYAQAVAEMYAHIQDGHGFISSQVSTTRKFVGQGVTPSVYGKVVENKFVITALVVDSVAKKEGLAVGDVILSINGKDILKLIDEQRPYQAASNYVTQTSYITNFLLCGDDGSTATLKIMDKDNKVKEVEVTRKRAYNKPFWEKKRVENAGPIFKLLSPEIGYVDMERLESNMIDSMLNTFKNTKGFIMDMRGYPKGTAWGLAPRLSTKNILDGALFTRLQPSVPDISADGNEVSATTTTVSFMQKLPTTTDWRYTGKTVMLMNETTQSQAEHSGLFFKAANNTIFIGSQTAGANGDVTNFNIPGFTNLTFSGQNVSYPNGQTMQRKGLVPDIVVKPTIKGIRAGKDEVLERAVVFLKTGK